MFLEYLIKTTVFQCESSTYSYNKYMSIIFHNRSILADRGYNPFMYYIIISIKYNSERDILCNKHIYTKINQQLMYAFTISALQLLFMHLQPHKISQS